MTATPSPTIPPEPVITFFGIARADDTVPTPVATATDGTPIFERDPSANCAGSLCAYDFSLVIEAKPGGTLAPVGSSTFNWSPSNPSSLPDLQVEASNKLGNGSGDVCDDSGPTAGGVPAVNPFDFSSNSAAAINDLSCRFQDGTGAPLGRSALDPCTKFGVAEVFQFMFPKVSTIQFCALIDKPIAFPVGDTVIAARVRDAAGNLSAVSSIIIRVPSP